MIYDPKTILDAPPDKYVCQRSHAGNVIWVMGPEDTREGACRMRTQICTCRAEQWAIKICKLLNEY